MKIEKDYKVTLTLTDEEYRGILAIGWDFYKGHIRELPATPTRKAGVACLVSMAKAEAEEKE